MSEEKRRVAHGGADPYADVIQLIRSRVIGDDELHAELITPYWGNFERMYGLFTAAEAFARYLSGEVANSRDMTAEEFLQEFALKYQQFPPE